AIWVIAGGGAPSDDERVRATPRLARARALAVAALVVAGVAAFAIVVRSGTCALDRAAADDHRIDDALAYAASLACPWSEHDAATPDELVPPALASAPRDAATTRFDRELRAAWDRDRARLVAALRPEWDGHGSRTSAVGPAEKP